MINPALLAKRHQRQEAPRAQTTALPGHVTDENAITEEGAAIARTIKAGHKVEGRLSAWPGGCSFAEPGAGRGRPGNGSFGVVYATMFFL